MATYILFWNPAISSYTMERFLDDFRCYGCVGNWSFHEHDEVEYDDYFYMVRCGEGRTGIVMRGMITSSCYEDKDWSPKGRKPIFYADIEDSITINPETAEQMLTPDFLTEQMPDFNWYGGHSGRKLSPEYAEKLDKIWLEYINANPKLFAENQAHISDYNDLLLSPVMRKELDVKHPDKCEICGYSYLENFGEVPEDLKNLMTIPYTYYVSPHLSRLIFRVCPSCDKVPDRIVIHKLPK